MANYTTKLKTWGAKGQEYPTNYSYFEQEAPVDAWDNFSQYNLIKDVKTHLIPLTNSRIESDTGIVGGEPANPEMSHLYHDTDNEALSFWDGTDNSWHRLLAADGDILSGNLDFDNNNALNVGKITGSDGTVIWNGASESSYFDSRYANIDSGGTEHPSYATLSDVPTTLTAGDVVYIENEDRLYIEDGK